MAYCTTCGGYFDREPDETWKRLCIPCWRKGQRGNAFSRSAGGPPMPKVLSINLDSEKAALRIENNTLSFKVASLEYKLKVLQFKLAAAEAQTKSSSDTKALQAMEWLKTNISALLMMLHPDRNGNSEKSTEITRWLIDFRKEYKK